MDNIASWIIAAFLICVLIVFCLVIFMPETQPVEEPMIGIESCEHDWVITSKYDFWRQSYKTISKCSKCGEEI